MPDSRRRLCGRCRKHLPLSSFNRNGVGHQWWCRDCFREYFRARGELHRRQSAAARQRRRRRGRDWVLNYLSDHPCIDCGEADLVVLEFDHIGTKRENVNRLVWGGASIRELREEVASCEVVCVNCHRRRSAKRGKWWRLDPQGLEGSSRLLPGELRNLVYIRDVLLSARCVDCGSTDLLVLDFDHMGGKRANVPVLARRGCSLRTLRDELKRCVVRCANCHRRRTTAQRRAGQAAA